MKNKVPLIILLLFVCTFVHSQTIHWIIFGDTKDNQNGGEVESSLSLLNPKFIDRVDDAMQAKGYFSKRSFYTGSRFSEQNCKDLIGSLSCDKNDIVVFYYLGHGARALIAKDQRKSYTQSHPWPDLNFKNGNIQKEYLSLEAVHNELKKKGARLTITIGMCCNEERSTHRKHSGPVMGMQAKRYKIVSKSFAKRIQKWFLRNKGDVIVSAASPDEMANGGWEYDSVSVDCFTGAFCETIDGYAQSESTTDITWYNFFKKVADRCKANAKELGEIQNVRFKTNLN